MQACGSVCIVMVLCLAAFWAVGALLLYFILILFTFTVYIYSFCVFKEGSWDYTLETQLLCLDWVVRLCYFILFCFITLGPWTYEIPH